MAKDLSNSVWHGVPRRDIPWFPEVDPEACIGSWHEPRDTGI